MSTINMAVKWLTKSADCKHRKSVFFFFFFKLITTTTRTFIENDQNIYLVVEHLFPFKGISVIAFHSQKLFQISTYFLLSVLTTTLYSAKQQINK